jgi:glycosyltransferase involved in cell wall biosynthesis
MIETGGLFDEQLATVFASADVYAFPSETETFGNVVVEAAASGLPAVVASAGASHEHVVDGTTGLVVDGKKPQQIADAILALFADPARRVAIGRAAREHATSYDLAAAVAATWGIYERVAAGHRTVEAA